MKPTKISLKKLIRKGSSSTTNRRSFDFLVNEKSLLSILSENEGLDLMGAFVEGFESENKLIAELLLCQKRSDSETGRILLYICPECGDIGCGAYGAIVEKIKDQYMWRDFAYENGYEEPQPIGIEPLYFNAN